MQFKKIYSRVFINIGIDQSDPLPQCNADTTKRSYRKRGYSSNGVILAFLGATTMF